MPPDSGTALTFAISKMSLGDKLCALHVARAYAPRHPGPVFVDDLGDVIEAYKDGKVHAGSRGRLFHIMPWLYHREKEPGLSFHYLGTFYRAMGLEANAYDRLELPYFPRPIERRYVALQPYSVFAQPNLAVHTIQRMIDHARNAGLAVLAVGKHDTRQEWEGVNYDFLGSVPNLLRVIQHAQGVLTPRSASAHVAAGYQNDAFIWTPDDEENWHLNYQFHNTRIPIRFGDFHIVSAAIKKIDQWAGLP